MAIAFNICSRPNHFFLAKCHRGSFIVSFERCRFIKERRKQSKRRFGDVYDGNCHSCFIISHMDYCHMDNHHMSDGFYLLNSMSMLHGWQMQMWLTNKTWAMKVNAHICDGHQISPVPFFYQVLSRRLSLCFLCSRLSE